MIREIRVTFEVEQGERLLHPSSDHNRSLHIQRQPEVCSSCGQDHKKNVEMNIWLSPNGPCQKTRHETFGQAYAEAKKQFPELP